MINTNPENCECMCAYGGEHEDEGKFAKTIITLPWNFSSFYETHARVIVI